MEKHEINHFLAAQLNNELADWEREELAENIFLLPETAQRQALKYLPVIWPISYALFNTFVAQLGQASTCLAANQYADWVKAILDVYESDGLRHAQLFMGEVENNFLCQIRGTRGVRLSDVEPRLLNYARSILGRDLNIAPATEISFDTETLFLPPEVDLCKDNRDNFLFYKFTASFLLSLDKLDTFRWQNNKTASISPLPSLQKKPQLYLDIFYLLEAIRISHFLNRNFQGLMNDCAYLLDRIAESRSGLVFGTAKAEFIEALRIWLLGKMAGQIKNLEILPQATITSIEDHYQNANNAGNSLALTEKISALVATLPGEYESAPLTFMGRLTIDKAFAATEKRKQALKDKFIQALAAILPTTASENPTNETTETGGERQFNDDPGTLLLIPAAENDEQTSPSEITNPSHILIGDTELDLPPELEKLATDIIRENGRIPQNYISSAVGQAGSGLDINLGDTPAAENANSLSGPLLYNEWDYRRAGFRKNWCSVNIKEISPTRGTFVENTLRKHKALLATLRQQFEMLSIEEKFLKRQREGDEIDLDALIESVADGHAGLAPSERLFIRRQRNDRNIAALFLIDMSSSTEGWVNTAIKESLILLCESLAALGDRYAIYSFSGMRRTRCEFFRIKDFEQDYDDLTQGRIAAISPKEYTRMGPAIRHATSILNETDAGVRLLITITDGKPEDYDGYKGTYAIEDTRHALIEAKNCGIHPFCITIDRKAHDYMEHLYGEVNYIFIDEVAKLPRRIPEIYRNLTT